MQDRLKFRCGITLSYYDENDDDKDVQIIVEPDALYTKYNEIGLSYNTLKNALHKLKLSDEEQKRIFNMLEDKECFDEWYVLAPDFYNQITGLKDKHGNHIYEGDIVELTRSRNYGWCKKGSRLEVVWNTFNCCGFGFGAVGNLTSKCAENCIVIGNIHENPELLEKE